MLLHHTVTTSMKGPILLENSRKTAPSGLGGRFCVEECVCVCGAGCERRFSVCVCLVIRYAGPIFCYIPEDKNVYACNTAQQLFSTKNTRDQLLQAAV